MCLLGLCCCWCMRFLLALLLDRPQYRCRELFGEFGDLEGLECRCGGVVEMVETFLWCSRISGWWCRRLIDIGRFAD